MILQKILYFLIIFITLSANAELRDVTIFQTTDIHGELSPWRNKKHGWLKIGTIIEDERAKIGIKNSLLIDCGDTIQGSLIASSTKGAVPAKLLNSLKYDIWVIGNHEFDYGLSILNERVSEVNATPLLANISYPKQNKKFIPWKIFVRNGIRIAIIGMGCPDLLDRFWVKRLPGIKVMSLEESLDRTLPAVVRAKPDMIVLAMHHGLYGSKRVTGNYTLDAIRKHPQIDLVLGGHFHKENAGTKIGKSSWFAQSGSHAGYLLSVTATVDISDHSVQNISSFLIPVKENTIESKQMKLKIAKEISTAKKLGWGKIGNIKHKLNPLEIGKSNSQLSELYARAISESSGTAVVMQGSSTKYSINPGTMTEWKLFRAYPYEDTICILSLTKKQLIAIIEEQLNMKRDKRFLSIHGAQVTVNSRRKVIDLKLEIKSRINKNKRYKVAFNSYSLAGASHKFKVLKKIAMLDDVKSVDTGIRVRDAIRDYIRKHTPISIKTTQTIQFNK